MKASILASLVLAVCAPTASDQGTEPKIKPGDTVMVSTEGTKFKVEDKVLGELKKGAQIVVTHVQDLWIGGNAAIDGKPCWGWVQRNHVALAVVIENATQQPWSYQARFSGDERWSDVPSLPPGQPHAYLARTRLVVRYQNGSRWITAVINPGERFRYQREELVNCRLNQNAGLKLRRLAVLAVADETYREQFTDWRDRIAEITATASHYYEDAVSIRLELVDCRFWDYKAARRGDTWKTAKALLAIESADAELVIGWIGVVQAQPRMPTNQYDLSWSAAFGRHLYIVDDERRQLPGATLLLLRALAHTFGAFHVIDKTSMMRWALGAVPIDFQFGDTVRQVILLSREFDFRRGVESLKPENVCRIQELYREHHHPDDVPESDPIRSGYRTQAFYRSLKNGYLQIPPPPPPGK